jgi:DNA-binding transcriptional LysR family regulator
MDVELRHLHAFSTVARLKSFTHAATELTITQPALTRTIQQLEAARCASSPATGPGHDPDARR